MGFNADNRPGFLVEAANLLREANQSNLDPEQRLNALTSLRDKYQKSGVDVPEPVFSFLLAAQNIQIPE